MQGLVHYTTVEEPIGNRRPATCQEIESDQVDGRFLRPSRLTSETVVRHRQQFSSGN